MTDATTWQQMLDQVWGRTFAERFSAGYTFSQMLQRELRREECRRDPYDRLLLWMKSLPDWRAQVCNCGGEYY